MYKNIYLINIFLYSIIIIVFNIHAADCTEKVHQEVDMYMYAVYSQYETFKEYYNLQIIENTPLIKKEYEPISITYFRTNLYMLDSI
jgi:hypothetical protein